MRVKDKVREDDGERQELVLTVVASPEEVKRYTDQFFGELNKREIAGFRKGKAPRAVLEQSVGGHDRAMGGVAETLINEGGFAAIDEADVIFIDEPQFNVEAPPEEGSAFTFTVSGPVAPLMKLTDYGPVSIEMPPEEATDRDVDRQIEQLRDHYHSFEDITDPAHEAALGDYVNVTLTVTNHDKVVSGLKGTSRMIGLGQGTMPASFDEHLIGAKAGEIREFDFEAKDEEGNSDYGDGELHAVVEVDGFRKYVLPELDDDFAGKVGCANVDDLRAQVKRSVGMQKAEELPRVKVDRAIDALLERLDGEVPAYYVDFFRQDVGREFMQDLEKQGTNLQQWMLQNAVNGDEMRDEIAEEALRRASIDCALESLFAEKGLEVTEEDVAALFEGDDDPQATRKMWEDAHRMADVHKMARQHKATQWLVDNAVVTIVEDGPAA